MNTSGSIRPHKIAHAYVCKWKEKSNSRGKLNLCVGVGACACRLFVAVCCCGCHGCGEWPGGCERHLIRRIRNGRKMQVGCVCCLWLSCGLLCVLFVTIVFVTILCVLFVTILCLYVRVSVCLHRETTPLGLWFEKGCKSYMVSLQGCWCQVDYEGAVAFWCWFLYLA